MDTICLIESDEEEGWQGELGAVAIAAPAPSAAATSWACSSCTFLNPPAFLACEVCGTQRFANSARPTDIADGGRHEVGGRVSARHAVLAAGTAAAAAAAGNAGHKEHRGTEPLEHQQAANSDECNDSSGGGWACGACTYRNSSSVAKCTMCGCAGPESTAAAASLAAVAAEVVAMESPVDGGNENGAGAPTSVLGGMPTLIPTLNETYTLDCGCRLPALHAQRHLQGAAAALPGSLPELVQHFRCPRLHCQQAVTRRDLAALLGSQLASKIDTHFWSVAAAGAAAADNTPAAGGAAMQDAAMEVVDLAEQPSAAAAAAAGTNLPLGGRGWRQLECQCVEAAVLLSQLHGVLVSSKLPAQQQQQQQQQHDQKGTQQKSAVTGTPALASPTGGRGSGRRGGRACTRQAPAQPPTSHGNKGWAQPPPWAYNPWGGGHGGFGYPGSDGYPDDEAAVGYWPSSHGNQRDARGNRPKGVGYGGSAGVGGKQAQQQQADAAKRQQQLDEAAAGLLQQLRQKLQAWEGAAQERLQPLPLPLLAALRGGPMAPLLRLLLQNDSLMDVSSRRQLYSQVFELVAALAASADLLPLLLQPADSDLLKAAGSHQPTQQQQQQAVAGAGEEASQSPEGSGRCAKRPRRGTGSSSRQPGTAAAAAAAGNGSNEPGGEPLAAAPAPSEDSSCWHALQALRLQADIFRRNAGALAAEGTADDLALVSAMLDLGEACQRVQEAVELWQSSTRGRGQQEQQAGAGLESASREGASGSGAGRSGHAQQQQQHQQQGGQQAADSPELRQQYEKALKPLLFQSLPLLQDHYYRQQAQQTSGGLNDRLRRITREVATLPGQLPLTWDSSVLAASDDERLDVLRAVIFAPEGTPYACGCFAFDIMLPQDYPNQPPKVHFLTTGGGRVRFNPNLYQDGKVCLSLLGTWQGPGWQPGSSTLLQVLVSIQAMILGTPEPYFNEPGYASMEGTAQGTAQSSKYNRNLWRHTLEVSILGQLQRPPAGFDQAVRQHFLLKAGVIKQQARDWAAKDRSLKQLSTQVIAALDKLAAPVD